MSLARSMSGMILLACLAACAKPSVQEAAPTVEPQAIPVPGSDRDAHGCIPSAGYAWCAHTGQCERPWELAKAQSFANTAEAFAAFCAAAKP